MKKLMLICAPVTSRSGYGSHSRDLVWSFIQHDKYEIKIIDVRWGDCPRNALDKNDTRDKQLLDCILPMPPQIDRQPDIYVDIRIPNEFETHGKFNIGITAGVETTAVSNKWIEGCNKMDLIIVPSEHSKQGFITSVWDKVQDLSDGKQQKIGEVKLEKPIEVLFEGADEDIYKPLKKDEISLKFLNDINDKVSEDFAFLFIGQWGNGGYGEDRKDISKMIKIFYESFANVEKQPSLILKTHGSNFSILDREQCLEKMKSVKSMFPSDWKLPNVYLFHGDLTDDGVNELYNHPKVKTMVSITHGEGFGRPLLEASMTGLPIIASSWSGQLDFLDGDNCMLIPGELKQVPKSAVWKDIIIPESKWFNVSENHFHNALKFCFEKYKNLKQKSNKLMKNNRSKFTLNNMSADLDKIMDKYTSSMPSQVNLKLPKLKKVNKDIEPLPEKMPKLKLPKLKKITDVGVSV
jgi:glycosyltransferase involved in cell wall biosynthesis